MNRPSDPQGQLAEIREYIAESNLDWSKSWVLGAVWSGLTLLAVLILVLARTGSPGASIVWALHNALGWGFTLWWCRHHWRVAGRSPLRGRYVLRLYAMLTAAIWLSVLATHTIPGFSNEAHFFVIALLLAAGTFATGLILDHAFSQVVGGVWLVSIGLCAVLVAPSTLAFALVMSIVAAGIVGTLGFWITEKRTS